ncbi:MAG: thioredoxin-disulfide reductase [Candidatus Omnitrophota bacterium]
MSEIFDVVIAGGGPAGLTAGLYASRARMKAVLLEKSGLCGGQALLTERIENFPGFPDGIGGAELSDWMAKQACRFGLEVRTAEAIAVAGNKDDKGAFSVKLAEGGELKTLSLIIATGARWNLLGIPGEKELTGRGVSYCATCDGPLFKGKDVVVVGGGDTALEDALFLTKFVNKVTIVHRRNMLRATKILQERVRENKKIELCLDSVATEITGKGKCEAVKIKDVNTGKTGELKASGVFIFIGITPNSDVVKNVVKTDEKGYVVTDDDMRTSVDGIFACGDIRKKLLRQVVTATGDGATAAFNAGHYVDRLKGVEYPGAGK